MKSNAESELHGAHDPLAVGEPGDEHPRHVGREAAGLLEERDAVHLGMRMSVKTTSGLCV